jgi:hypothetical protein
MKIPTHSFRRLPVSTKQYDNLFKKAQGCLTSLRMRVKSNSDLLDPPQIEILADILELVELVHAELQNKEQQATEEAPTRYKIGKAAQMHDYNDANHARESLRQLVSTVGQAYPDEFRKGTFEGVMDEWSYMAHGILSVLNRLAEAAGEKPLEEPDVMCPVCEFLVFKNASTCPFCKAEFDKYSSGC